jgi:hypothetical protein
VRRVLRAGGLPPTALSLARFCCGRSSSGGSSDAFLLVFALASLAAAVHTKTRFLGPARPSTLEHAVRCMKTRFWGSPRPSTLEHAVRCMKTHFLGSLRPSALRAREHEQGGGEQLLWALICAVGKGGQAVGLSCAPLALSSFALARFASTNKEEGGSCRGLSSCAPSALSSFALACFASTNKEEGGSCRLSCAPSALSSFALARFARSLARRAALT